MSLESWKRLVSRSPLLTTLHITKQENLLEILAVLVESPHHRIQLRHLRVEENYVAGANVRDRRKN
jgi:hypothetical protein